MKLFSRDGQPMVDVTKIEADGDNLVMQCKLMNAYSMKIYLQPEELRAALPLLNWSIISALPNMLVTGTKSEESLRQLGGNISNWFGEASKALLGEYVSGKLKEVEEITGASTVQGMVDSMLPILAAVLADKEKEPQAQ